MKVVVKVYTPDNASHVLTRMQEILGVIDSHKGNWPTTDEWRARLPTWFSSFFFLPRSRHEIEQELEIWREMSNEEKAQADVSTQWSLDDWLYWLHPEQRQWHFVDGKIVSPQQIDATLEVEDLPAALGAFDWLARAAGATSTEEP